MVIDFLSHLFEIRGGLPAEEGEVRVVSTMGLNIVDVDRMDVTVFPRQVVSSVILVEACSDLPYRNCFFEYSRSLAICAENSVLGSLVCPFVHCLIFLLCS